jgi:hypothetical protein
MNPFLFEPWEGPQYGEPPLGRLLILGDSHYFFHEEQHYASYTKRIIQGLGTDKSKDNDFYIKVGQIFHPTDYLDIWPKVAFANAIQHPFQESRPYVTRAHYRTVEPAVRAYLEWTRPDKMIVFSSRVWNRGLPSTWGRSVETLHDATFGRQATVWSFEYPNGVCHGIGVHHPSSVRPPFKPDEWRPLVTKFLERDYEKVQL